LKQEKIPDWVRWLAQDESGIWWGFEAEPNQGHNFWYENEVGRCVRLQAEQVNSNWRSSLKRINKKRINN
jgi:hypothetical protein